MTTELTATEARTLALHAQGFIGPADPDVRTMLKRVGAVQLDTISVLARSHELVAYARLGPVGCVKKWSGFSNLRWEGNGACA